MYYSTKEDLINKLKQLEVSRKLTPDASEAILQMFKDNEDSDAFEYLADSIEESSMRLEKGLLAIADAINSLSDEENK